MASTLYRIENCPIPTGEANHHEGVEALVEMMGNHGLKLYQTEQELPLGGREGLIAKDDVVLLKINAQWKYRGCTNSDVVRGLIQRILEHPEGFDGEIVLTDNGQGGGSMNCDMIWEGYYPDTTVHANAEDESHTFSFLVDEVFRDPRVSTCLLDSLNEMFISSEDHTTDGYRRLGDVSYPCFRTARGNRVELREGIWNGSEYRGNLKLINMPVLKHHDGGCGITGAVKNFYGVLSMSDGHKEERHYDQLGRHCGAMIGQVRPPVLSILDCIRVSLTALSGYPPDATRRLNTLLVSRDPLALDYWASKHLLYPIDGNEAHHPDRFAGLRDPLIQACAAINASGGIFGQEVVMDEKQIDVITQSL
ncbi:MAG: DUF362 domain-containing protein [Armatimonadetes bacterium]|nr:DUF362 domain-containing protein [Armatimonadota bacterium]